MNLIIAPILSNLHDDLLDELMGIVLGPAVISLPRLHLSSDITKSKATALKHLSSLHLAGHLPEYELGTILINCFYIYCCDVKIIRTIFGYLQFKAMSKTQD